MARRRLPSPRWGSGVPGNRRPWGWRLQATCLCPCGADPLIGRDVGKERRRVSCRPGSEAPPRHRGRPSRRSFIPPERTKFEQPALSAKLAAPVPSALKGRNPAPRFSLSDLLRDEVAVCISRERHAPSGGVAYPREMSRIGGRRRKISGAVAYFPEASHIFGICRKIAGDVAKSPEALRTPRR
jgi:hypothetical protein